MSGRDRAVNRDGLHPVTKKNLEHFKKDEFSSIGCGTSLEPTATRKPAPCEVVYTGQGNSHIVFGRDRPGSRLSGYGGRGHTHSEMIDICVGLGGVKNQQDLTPTGGKKLLDPDLFDDAARIYISQKCDIDHYFRCPKGSGFTKAKSAIAIKADAVRLISREGIKIISSSDVKNSRDGDGSPESADGTEGVIFGIDLIAGNDTDPESLEPLVKGKALVKCLDEIITAQSQLASLVFSMFKAQMEYNAVLACHWHFSPFMGAPVSCSPDALTGAGQVCTKHTTEGFIPIMLLQANCEMQKYKYLKPVVGKYILSQHNKTN